MKKQILTMLIAALCLAFSPYQIQEERLVINVEIPVRVLKGNTFVDNLTTARDVLWKLLRQLFHA